MAKKSFKDNNIVIICEGTETEYPYFEYIKDKVQTNFDDIKVVPSPDDKDALQNLRKSEKGKSRKLVPKDKESQKTPHLYITLEESEDDVDKNYDKYKQAPAKYTREAYLWLKKGYSEAWAVYDLDDTDDPDHSVHKCANELIENSPFRLHKAFSAYSFEEWILLNFERCATAFRHSACKSIKAKNEDYNCKGRSCHYKSRCTAECIGDYLTRNGYADYVRSTYPNPITIKDKGYSKKDGKSYAQAICEDATLRHRAYVNAAWSRSLNNGVFYDCNPYSDVDRLIMRLLNDEKDIHWIKTNEEFKLGVNKFTIKQKNGILYISHQGAENCVINDGQIYWCDDHFYDFQSSAISGVNISFTVDNNKDKQLVLSDSYTILCIKNGNQEFYFDNSITKPIIS